MSQLSLSTLAQNLKIPPDFLRLEYITDTVVLSELEHWKHGATSMLEDILQIVRAKERESLPVDIRGDVLFAALPFSSQPIPNKDGSLQAPYGNEPWISSDSQLIANDILSSNLLSPSPDLITQILAHKLKPIFKFSPHPHLHVETGRKVFSHVGGPLAVHDYYEDQKWKEYPGVEKIILWCVSGIQENAYETMWHLLIPPIMTLLDDYEARNKLHGVVIVQQMLLSVQKDLLRRTGVDGLLRQSLKTSLSYLQSPETPQLLKRAIEASVCLTLLTTSTSQGTKPSPNRFNELSSLLGEGIISGIWIYAEDKPDAVNATFEALPSLLNALSIGSIRFMKPLIPQLTHTLIPRPLVESDIKMQLSAIRVLDTLLDVCKPRIEPWKETILNAIGRCWVGLIDEESSSTESGAVLATCLVRIRVTHWITVPQNQRDTSEVKRGLQMLCVKLAKICPSAIQNEFPRFLQANKALFEGLLPRQVNIVPA
ncbi:hypothetical protein CVT25_005424 [Psilocybe cyanescens]|uniref:Uncharacterized protein n=1 Tax=Psilocybe cyanescens TaxID=93625 RepID=A0A409VQN3_PSICY|nr:hypothetical protein CVT25_005424 [Psilocybe cyanescens]